MTTHGGKREGAGRPAAFKPTPVELKYVADLLVAQMGKKERSDEELVELARYFFTEAHKLEQKQARQ